MLPCSNFADKKKILNQEHERGENYNKNDERSVSLWKNLNLVRLIIILLIMDNCTRRWFFDQPKYY